MLVTMEQKGTRLFVFILVTNKKVWKRENIVTILELCFKHKKIVISAHFSLSIAEVEREGWERSAAAWTRSASMVGAAPPPSTPPLPQVPRYSPGRTGEQAGWT